MKENRLLGGLIIVGLWSLSIAILGSTSFLNIPRTFAAKRRLLARRAAGRRRTALYSRGTVAGTIRFLVLMVLNQPRDGGDQNGWHRHPGLAWRFRRCFDLSCALLLGLVIVIGNQVADLFLIPAARQLLSGDWLH